MLYRHAEHHWPSLRLLISEIEARVFCEDTVKRLADCCRSMRRCHAIGSLVSHRPFKLERQMHCRCGDLYLLWGT